MSIEPSQQHVISSIDDLREVVGDEIPGLAEKNIDHIDDYARTFIARSPLIVLSTADAAGRIDASPKGDDAGFVLVEDDRTLVIPDRPGNKLAYGHQNILSNPRVGLLLLIPGTAETLRINGTAELSRDPALLDRLAARGKPAVLAIRIHVEECFFHCGKAFIRSKLWQADSWPEKQRISFGEMYAGRREQDAATAQAIDEAVAADYRDNL